MDLTEIRKLKHAEYLEAKAKEALIKEQNEKMEKEINEKIDNILSSLYQKIDELSNTKEYIYANIIIASIYFIIKHEIDFLKTNQKIETIQNIFFEIINTINSNNDLKYNLNTISYDERKSVEAVQKHIYNIMDLLNIDKNILDINKMDTSNDETYAKNLQETYYLDHNDVTNINNYTINGKTYYF